MSKIVRLIVGCAGLWPLLAKAEPAKIPHGTVDLISAVSSIQPGSSFQLGLRFQLEPGWHIYWSNPGDSGQPPRLTWKLPDELSAGDIEWPAPKRIPVASLMDYGYEGDVLLPVTLTAKSNLRTVSSQLLEVNLHVLVCRETCMPGHANLSLSLPVRRGPAQSVQANIAKFAEANERRPQALPAVWKASAQQSPSEITLSLAGLPAGTKVDFIPAFSNQIENAAAQKAVIDGLVLKRPAQGAQDRSTLEGLLYVDHAGSRLAYKISTGLSRASAVPPIQTQGLFTILLFAFGGGLILNLMPCVFPVLSIKVLSLLEHSGGERNAIRLSAGFYTFGVLASFWVLVAALLGLRATGRSLGWGFQLQSPAFVACLIFLLFALGLSLIGVFELGTSVMNVGSGLTQRGKYSGSFFTGVLATVVATPCTAPLMGVAVGFALVQSPLVCLLVFTAMAIGLASPFLLLSVFPQFARLLPRPGAWMETLKQVMAFPVFATVVWLLWVVGQQVGINQLAVILMALLAVAIAGWIAGKWPRRNGARLGATAVGLAVSIGCAAMLVPVQAAALSTAGSELKWEAFTPEKLASYRASGKPVLIDYTAAWCLTCQVNDRVVFHSPEVTQHLVHSDIALLRADWTSNDPIITASLSQFGRSGIPFYVIYGRQASAEPITLPDGILTPSAFLQNLGRLNL